MFRLSLRYGEKRGEMLSKRVGKRIDRRLGERFSKRLCEKWMEVCVRGWRLDALFFGWLDEMLGERLGGKLDDKLVGKWVKMEIIHSQLPSPDERLVVFDPCMKAKEKCNVINV
jgi:hypothetical protein